MKPLEHFALGNAQAWSFAPLPTGLAQRARVWLESGPSAGDQVLKPGRVWRAGEFAVKRFESEPSVRLGLRRSPALRSAAVHFRLLPIRSPRPFLVLEDRSLGSLLVSEFVEGGSLAWMWNGGGAGVQAFPLFLAAMHRRRIFHGDFHLNNVLWDGREWVLLDLDGLRPPLRSLRTRTNVIDHWARVHLSLRGSRGLQESYRSYLAAAQLDFEIPWAEIVERSRELAHERGIETAYADRDGLDPFPW